MQSDDYFFTPEIASDPTSNSHKEHKDSSTDLISNIQLENTTENVLISSLANIISSITK